MNSLSLLLVFINQPVPLIRKTCTHLVVRIHVFFVCVDLKQDTSVVFISIFLFVYLYNAHLMRYLLAIRFGLQFETTKTQSDHGSCFNLNNPTTIYIRWIISRIIRRKYSSERRIGKNRWLITPTSP